MRWRVCGIIAVAVWWLAGCAGIREGMRGIAGISTKVLEDGLSNALAKDFDLDERPCFSQAQYVLGHSQASIYATDLKKNMIAVYVSEKDTTPVGVFVQGAGPGKARVLVSSPSTYAKELIAGLVFSGIERSLKEKNVQVQLDAIEPVPEKQGPGRTEIK